MIDRELHLVIGKRVKTLRSSKKVTQKILADALGISQTHLSNMENGVTGFTLDNIVKAREFFKCDIRCFFDDELLSSHCDLMAAEEENLTSRKKILSKLEKNKGVFDIDSEALDKILRMIEILKS